MSRMNTSLRSWLRIYGSRKWALMNECSGGDLWVCTRRWVLSISTKLHESQMNQKGQLVTSLFGTVNHCFQQQSLGMPEKILPLPSFHFDNGKVVLTSECCWSSASFCLELFNYCKSAEGGCLCFNVSLCLVAIHKAIMKPFTGSWLKLQKLIYGPSIQE